MTTDDRHQKKHTGIQMCALKRSMSRALDISRRSMDSKRILRIYFFGVSAQRTMCKGNTARNILFNSMITALVLIPLYGLNAGFTFSFPLAPVEMYIVPRIKITPEVNYLFAKEPKGDEVDLNILQIDCSFTASF
jgi:hypothetical protein